ncbi:MAG TPA: MarR family transcriptional regulator [Vulgatibacter sp.]|nr:MarR family transcriptional regulator [Vulgatibacter sp.]
MRRSLVLDDFLPYRLSVAANAVSRVIARSYEDAGLRTNEWRVLAVLAEDGPSSQQRLVGRTQMDKVAVSRAATALADEGLVRRREDPDDARALILSLTARGRALHRRLAPRALALEDALAEGLSARDLATLGRLLRRLEDAAGRLLAEE